MQFGVCRPIEEAATAAAAGFNYLECTVVSLEPESEQGEILTPFLKSPLPVKVYNVFLPGDLKVVGEEIDYERVEAYLDSALERVRLTGADRVVFGSGRSRNVPAGLSHEKASAQLVRFLRMAGDAAASRGITIVIEPLNRGESNIINSVTEGVEYARRADHESVRVLADLYHMMVENEPLDVVAQWSEWLEHVHVADSERGAPGSGSYPYAAFFDHLHDSGYSGSISIECRWDDFSSQGADAVTFLREMWAGQSGEASQ